MFMTFAIDGVLPVSLTLQSALFCALMGLCCAMAYCFCLSFLTYSIQFCDQVACLVRRIMVVLSGLFGQTCCITPQNVQWLADDDIRQTFHFTIVQPLITTTQLVRLSMLESEQSIGNNTTQDSLKKSNTSSIMGAAASQTFISSGRPCLLTRY